jgi:DNA-binding NarL/FixJ family response regulator
MDKWKEHTAEQVLNLFAGVKKNRRGTHAHRLRVVNNEIWLDSDTVRSLISARSAHAEQVEHRRPLTYRQAEVLRGILDGLANKEIAWNMKVSESSIKAVIQELFHKAGVRTRSQLVRIANRETPLRLAKARVERLNVRWR